MVDQVALRRLCVLILLPVVLFVISVNVHALTFHNEYKIWCDCDGDGVADIVKTVNVGPFDTLESTYPSCCCRLLRSEKVEFPLAPLPFAFPDVEPSDPGTIPSPIPSRPPASIIAKSLHVPYDADSGQARIDVRIRVAGGTNWYLQREVIVDTGAGITMFPKKSAVALGLDPKTGQEIVITDVSGSKLHAWIHKVEIQFVAPNGKTLAPIEIRAAFVESDELPVLLGRRDVMEKVSITFQDDGFTITSR